MYSWTQTQKNIKLQMCLPPHLNYALHSYFIFVTNPTNISVEKKLSCGEISNFYAWHMWRILNFFHVFSNFPTWQMWTPLCGEISTFYIANHFALHLQSTMYFQVFNFISTEDALSKPFQLNGAFLIILSVFYWVSQRQQSLYCFARSLLSLLFESSNASH